MMRFFAESAKAWLEPQHLPAELAMPIFGLDKELTSRTVAIARLVG